MTDTERPARLRDTNRPEDVVGGAATDTGIVRDQNEDAVQLWSDATPHLATNGRLFALADGLGGHSRGEVASAEAIAALFARYYREPAADLVQTLKQAVRAANERIYALGAGHDPHAMMGTTLVAGVILQKTLTVANVGDSRAYILRGKRAQQVTRDHSVVEEQLRAGAITLSEALHSANRNVITRALGQSPKIDVDIFEVPLLPNDGVLLASDGLYQVFAPDEMANLAMNLAPPEAAAALVHAAAERQSRDNASAVVIHYAPAAALAAAGTRGRDLFDTAPLPPTTPARRRGRVVGLVAAAVIALLVLIALVLLVLAGPLWGLGAGG